MTRLRSDRANTAQAVAKDLADTVERATIDPAAAGEAWALGASVRALVNACGNVALGSLAASDFGRFADGWAADRAAFTAAAAAVLAEVEAVATVAA